MMAIRWRLDGRLLCAAKSAPKDGDTYIDDRLHYHLSVMARVLIADVDHETNRLWHWLHGADGLMLRAVRLEEGLIHYAECPGCAVALAPDAAHAEGCEWLVSVKAGLKAKREGRLIPWSEVKRELGIEDAPQRDIPDEDVHPPAPVPTRKAIRDEHVHQCPSDGTTFRCVVRHRAGTILLRRQEVALCPNPHRREP